MGRVWFIGDLVVVVFSVIVIGFGHRAHGIPYRRVGFGYGLRGFLDGQAGSK